MRLPAAALAVAAPLLMAAGTPGPSRPSGNDRDLQLVNRARAAITEVYASPSSSDQWGQDRLPEDSVPPGRSVRIPLGRVRDCEFDVQVVYQDGSHEDVPGLDVCRARQLVVDGSHAVVAPGFARAEHPVTLTNLSARPVQQVFMSGPESNDWGDDRLPDSTLSVGQSTTVVFSGSCVADLRVVFDNRSAEERRGVDICASTRIALRPGWTTEDPETRPHADIAPPAVPMALRLANKAGVPVRGLYVFRDGSADPGPQLLGPEGLSPGQSTQLRFSRPERMCRFTARVVFAPPQTAQDITGLDLCQAAEIEIPAPT